MADNIQLGEGTSGKYSRTKEISAGVHIGKVIPVTSSDVEISPLTDTQLRATPVPVSGTVTATTGGLTDTQLRATPVPVSGTVTTGGLTDTQLRATPVPVSGTVTTGGLTDTQLRATPVPVSGTVTANATLAAETTKVIGTVNVASGQTIGLAAGTANIGDVDVLSLPAIPAGNNNIGDVDIASIAAGDNNIGNVDVVTLPALPAGTNNIGDVDVLSLPALPAGSNLVGDVGISGARTSGGTTPYKNLDVDETEDEVKGSAGQVYWIHAVNLKATPLYLKFYNATAANVTVGTTTPVLTLPVPSAGATTGAGFNLSIPNGIAFSTAITIAATTGVADNDTGAPGANELIVNLGYA